MARQRPGKKYPHITTDARPHDHSMCPVVQAAADRVVAGADQWGERHPLPPVPSASIAAKLKGSFYAARYCRKLADRYGEPLSVQAGFDRAADDAYVVWFRVWPRTVARAEIVRRVKSGEPLHYNVVKG